MDIKLLQFGEGYPLFRMRLVGMRLYRVMNMMLSSCLLLLFCFSKVVSKTYFVVSPGDTFTDGSVKYTMTSMNVPEPVMSLAVQPVSKDSGGQVSVSSRRVYFLYI